MCKAIDKKSVCCLPTYSKSWPLISEFRPFLSGLLYLGYRWWNQAMVLGNFQCRGVLLFLRILGALACSRCGLGLFRLSSPIFSLSKY